MLFNYPHYRFEIEKKLKRAKKKEMKEQKSLERSMASHKSESSNTSSVPLDLKDRVKERKKNVEENKGKGDKKVAMSLLKARREEKKERGTYKINYNIIYRKFKCYIKYLTYSIFK